MKWNELIGPLQPVPASAGLADWYAKVVSQADTLPLSLALYGGRAAATPGLAFLAGYQATLRALWPDAPQGLGAFCATENRKLRPADMETRIRAKQITGSKDFVTGGHEASWLLVSAREEEGGEPIRLGMYSLRVGSSGVLLDAGRPLPLISDIPHARLRLDQAEGARLAGDGWHDYVVPFRTFEDLYVLAALSAWLYGVGMQQRWSKSLVLRLMAVGAGAAEVSRQLPHQPGGHFLLAALIEQFDALQPELNCAFGAGDSLGDLWRRDSALLGLAHEAKARRLQKATAALGLFAEEKAGQMVLGTPVGGRVL